MTTDDIIITNLEAIIASQHETISHLMDLYNSIPESDPEDMSQVEFDLADARDTVQKQAGCIRELLKDVERLDAEHDVLKGQFLAANRCLMAEIDAHGATKRELLQAEATLISSCINDDPLRASPREHYPGPHHDGTAFGRASVYDLVVVRKADGSTQGQPGPHPVIAREPVFSPDMSEFTTWLWMPEGGSKHVTLKASEVQVWHNFAKDTVTS